MRAQKSRVHLFQRRARPVAHRFVAGLRQRLLAAATVVRGLPVFRHEHNTKKDSTARGYARRGRFGERRAKKTNACGVVVSASAIAERRERG
jgi:hypothetical protein